MRYPPGSPEQSAVRCATRREDPPRKVTVLDAGADPDLAELQQGVVQLQAALSRRDLAAIQALLPKLATLAAVWERKSATPATHQALTQLRPLLRACRNMAQDHLDLLEFERQLFVRWAGEPQSSPQTAVDRLV